MTVYRIYANEKILHNPMLSDSGHVVIDPVLVERLNTQDSLRFSIAPSNPLYDEIQPRETMIKVVSDTNSNNKPWFGRVISVERGWNNVKNVQCEGVLGFFCDSVMGPFAFKGSPAELLSAFIYQHNASTTRGPVFYVGNVSVVDPNNTIVRSSDYAYSVWEAMMDKLFESSLGGYLMHRYDAEHDKHYIDYLSLDGNDPYARTSSQIVKFGRNLLDFEEFSTAQDVITVLIPYGSLRDESDPDYETEPQPSQGEFLPWDGNRVTIDSVNGGLKYIEDAEAIAIWGRIVGTKVWDDVEIPSNLLTKAQTYLATQAWQSITLELSAVDLSFVDADIEQIQIGEYVRCQSVPHGLNVLLLCTEKQTRLTKLESSVIILGAGLKTITDMQKGANL